MSFNKQCVVLLILTASVLLLPLQAQPASPAQSEWIPITQDSDGVQFYSGKRGSYELTTTKAGIQVALFLGQVEDKKKKSVSYSKWYVSTADCDAGLGKLVVLKLNGDFDFESDFVAKGSNIASGIADAICSVYQADAKKKLGKGI